MSIYLYNKRLYSILYNYVISVGRIGGMQQGKFKVTIMQINVLDLIQLFRLQGLGEGGDG